MPRLTDSEILAMEERGTSVCCAHRAVWPECVALHGPVSPAAPEVNETPSEHVANGAIALLASGLRNRGFAPRDNDPQTVVSRALDVIDQYDRALAAATREADELEGGLTVEQELRVQAGHIAARVLTGRYSAVMDAAGADVVAVATRLVRFLADGRPCTCRASPGEHPHTARGCDIEHCGCRWTPPPLDHEPGADIGQHGGEIYVRGPVAAPCAELDDMPRSREPEWTLPGLDGLTRGEHHHA